MSALGRPPNPPLVRARLAHGDAILLVWQFWDLDAKKAILVEWDPDEESRAHFSHG